MLECKPKPIIDKDAAEILFFVINTASYNSNIIKKLESNIVHQQKENQ